MLSTVSRITHHAPRSTPSQRGVALVITLVLLSIITFMAVTFLVLSRSQHGSVVTETDRAVARLGAEGARERAIAQLVATIQASTNEYNYGLLVSANYINPDGFTPNVNSPLNVNYDHKVGGGPIPSALEWERNIANLLYDPRAPVFITNRLFANSNEFRFYLDLNRNGRDDPNGLQPVIVRNPQGDLSFYDLNGGYIPYRWPLPARLGIVSNYFVGDPEWIGALRRPEFAHSADNQFVYRYAYIALPAGQALDLNNIHNDAKRLDLNKPGNDGFFRNQGVLAAELNLAAFLVDLNTNLWPASAQSEYNFQYYTYSTSLGLASSGAAADDAAALLRWRYAGNWNNLASVSALFPGNGPTALDGAIAFGQDYIDGYSAGPLMVGTSWPPPNPPLPSTDSDRQRVKFSWSGADNPNHFYTTQDLFDQSKTRLPSLRPQVPSFTDRLKMAGTNVDSYNGYTFYRLLSQLGPDSAPEPGGKINLNYCNVDANGYVVPNMATNFLPWQPTNFFRNAAIRLLVDAGYTVGDPNSTSNLLVLGLGSKNVNGVSMPVTNLNIPIYPINLYTPSVHRILQLAANIYDATTNRTDYLAKPLPYLPTVFRPVFTNGPPKGPVRISIIGYQEVTANDTQNLVYNPRPPHDLTNPNDRMVQPLDMVYGVPLVIGAKKGLPNFNEFAMKTLVQVTRKLQFHRPDTSTTKDVNEIDQMFVVGISNVLGVEAWNSYAAAYPRNLQLVVWPDISVQVTNLESRKLLRNVRYQPLFPATTNILPLMWPGYNPTFAQYSFQVPLLTNLVFLSNMTYRAASDSFVPLTGEFERISGTTNFHVPHWALKLKSRLRFAVVDIDAGRRIVDYVNLVGDTDLNITEALTTGGGCGTPYTPDGSNGGMWCTNRLNGGTDPSIPTFGIQNQIEASLGHTAANWNASTHEFPAGMSVSDAIAFFKGQFIPGYLRSSNTFSTPYQPFRNLYLVTSWQANDPLVHYTVGDLTDLVHTNLVVDQFSDTAPDPTARIGLDVNARYEPWGGNPSGRSSSPVKFDMTVKDPLMLRSDNWDFPTNKFPNPGWLGRVHRGTPWQTAYLKSFGVPNYPNWFKNWQAWSGNGQVVTNAGQLSFNLVGFNAWANDAFFAQPTNDWRLLDLFTTALNDNATRGQLSVNQTNLAAWSAVLSGVIVLTNNLDAKGNPVVDGSGNPVMAWLPIQPAGLYNASDPTTWPPLVRLVNAINIARFKSNPRHVFSRLGDILATPELTTASPFLNTNNTPSLGNNGLSDAAYERLPQQILGLLKADSVPRFVIYAFSQTLKPESTRAIVKSGPFAGLCTNYQIVAEAATRTVVRFQGVQPYLGANPPAITNLLPVIESYNDLPTD
jgi:hypothetical protein